MDGERSGSGALERTVRDAGAIWIVWGLVVLAEFVVVAFGDRRLFAGNWELIVARKLVAPIAVAMVAPLVPLAVALGRLFSRAERRTRARLLASTVVLAFSVVVGVGVTGGRHFDRLFVRAAAVALLGVVAFGATYVALPVVGRLRRDRRGRLGLLALAITGACGAWLADVLVLPRLYPAFHDACFLLVFGFASAIVAARRSPPGNVPRSEFVLASLALVLGLVACAWVPVSARRLDRADNLRLVLVEKAPILGRAVRFAAWLVPPAEPEASDAAPRVGEVARELDWTGSDIVLVSVDALRADHLGAYGYARATTPNLDALAARSATFLDAYCPTPHTSYSVTSMMTGKAMRPLLSLGLGASSETWATYLRRYGYKTAAFYPPAVFYIDAERFAGFAESGLGFEYRWVEFTSADEKVAEVSRYLARAGSEPLFLWVHIFEPHEPYEPHPGHEFGAAPRLPVDLYDSEVAYADAAIGRLLEVVQQRRGGRPLVTIVTADHGEEFGEHGGRYHGTTCYEEQVRVPLLVSGPGVVARPVETVVQTIDLLPTVLSSLGIPRPARLQGRDLGGILAHGPASGASADDASRTVDPGLAYAETDEQTLVAKGDERLVCARKLGACALYDVKHDRGEQHDLGPSSPSEQKALRALSARIELEQGAYERAEVAWPEALRRGMQGDADAAVDVAGLLDDASVVVRRKAAEVLFQLAVVDAAPAVKRALARDEDDEVRRWASLTLVRLGQAKDAGKTGDALLAAPEIRWRRAAALAFAESGDARGKTELAAWWREAGPQAERRAPRLDDADAKVVLRAIARIRDAEAVPSLLDSLSYVPLRPMLADALGAIGDGRATSPLLELLAHERYETARPNEARALVALGAGEKLGADLTLFAGLPDPMVEAVGIMADAKLLDARRAGAFFDVPRRDVEVRIAAPSRSRAARVWVLSAAAGGELTGSCDDAPFGEVRGGSLARYVDVEESGSSLVRAHDPKGIRAIWMVPRLRDVPPELLPPKRDGGLGNE